MGGSSGVVGRFLTYFSKDWLGGGTERQISPLGNLLDWKQRGRSGYRLPQILFEQGGGQFDAGLAGEFFHRADFTA